VLELLVHAHFAVHKFLECYLLFLSFTLVQVKIISKKKLIYLFSNLNIIYQLLFDQFLFVFEIREGVYCSHFFYFLLSSSIVDD
jgi:hypothetical protein